MSTSLIEHTPSAYDYPLLIKHLLHTPLATAPEQEIVYRDISRYTYRTLRQRIGRLASGLAGLGIKPGDTVAVMDWDSHRYLECYFAVPMMGAVLQTVNVRLSPAEIAYTINHAGAEILLVYTDFLPVVEAIKDKLEAVHTFVWIEEEGSEACAHTIPFSDEYENLLARSASSYVFPDFDENTRATTFYTTHAVELSRGEGCRSGQVESHHRRRRIASRTGARRARPWHRYLHRLRHVRDVPLAEPHAVEAGQRGHRQGRGGAPALQDRLSRAARRLAHRE